MRRSKTLFDAGSSKKHQPGMAHTLFEPVAFVDPPPPWKFYGIKISPQDQNGQFSFAIFHNPIN